MDQKASQDLAVSHGVETREGDGRAEAEQRDASDQRQNGGSPEAHQAMKGKNRHFGFKAHVGVGVGGAAARGYLFVAS